MKTNRYALLVIATFLLLTNAVPVQASDTKTYPGNSREIEAYFLLGQIEMEGKNRAEALRQWELCFEANERQKRAGNPGNDYFAAEAQFEVAGDLDDKFMTLKIQGIGKGQKESQIQMI